MTQRPRAERPRRDALRRGLVAAALLTALWAVLTEGRLDGWIIGVPVVAAGIASALWLPRGPLWRLQLLYVPRFLVYFVHRSILGGLDVARRSLFRLSEIYPGVVPYRTRIEDPPAKLFMAATIGVLPGTMVVDVQGDTLFVHTLDVRADIDREIRILEAHVRRLFGLAASPQPDLFDGAPQTSEDSPLAPRGRS